MVQVIQKSSQSWKDEKTKKTTKMLHALEGVSKEQEAARLAARLGFPYLDLHVFPANPEDMVLIPEEDAKRLRIAAFDKAKGALRVAFADPENREAVAFVNELAGKHEWTVEAYVVSMQ